VQDEKLLRRLTRRKIDAEKLAAELIARPRLLPEFLGGLESDTASVKFGCAKVLRIVSEREPAVLYPDIKRFFDLLESDNQIIKWNAILIVGNLAAVDSKGKIGRILGKYLEPIPGPELVTAANVIVGATRIALAKPRLTDKIVEALLKVARARYRTRDCRNVATGHAIDALDQLYAQTKKKETVARFITRQCKNPRNATRKKAERFVKRRLAAG
jgi:hypothetical protein